MAPKPDPTVPLIITLPASNTPGHPEHPSPDYFPAFTPHSPLTPARSASPATPAMRPTTPIPLLRTPPVEAISPSGSGARIMTNDEVIARSPRSSARMTRTTSPSGNHSTTLSPSISSGGGSVYSSGTGHSPCSISSSEYLTPPQFQADCDKRPYRARRGSSGSLKMVREPKRARTLPHGSLHTGKRRRRHHKCNHGKEDKYEHATEHWLIPGCQVAPTAPKGTKELCEGHVGRYRPIESNRGNSDTFGRLLPRLRSEPAPPIVSRRWSSVEIGSHQVHLASTLPARSMASTPGNPMSDADSPFPRPYRSSTLTPGAIDHDIVRAVRERLTLRKVPVSPVQPPATITLRRASAASTMTGMSTVTELLTPVNGPETGNATPQAYSRGQGSNNTDVAYLITRKDIDSITELIEANLRRNYRPHNRISAHPPLTPPSRPISPASISRGKIVQTSSITNSSLTITQAKPSRSRTQESLDFLQVTSKSQLRTRGLTSQRSSHEIIWEPGAGSSPERPSSISFGERKQSSSANSSPRGPSPCQPTIKPQESPPKIKKSEAFDPVNSQQSITDWSWRLPPAEIPLIVTSSNSEANDSSQTSDVPLAVPPKISSEMQSEIRIRSVASAPDVPRYSGKGKGRAVARPAPSYAEIKDVVSFPPLAPRKTTNDWYSPLPDITSPAVSPAVSPGPGTLYPEGIDATVGVPVLLKLAQPPKAAFSPLTHSSLPSANIEFDPGYDMRRKSVVKGHPNHPARTGDPSAMGSSIGASSGERRKSSVNPGLKRVSTIDHIDKGKRSGTWTRNRPPSVCPAPKTPTPGEIHDGGDYTTLHSARKSSQLVASSIEGLGPEQDLPVPKADRLGIYEKITGTVKSVLGFDKEHCEDECFLRHECDDCNMCSKSPNVDWIG